MIPIVQKGDPVLRKDARAVPISEIESPRIQRIIKKMTEALYQEEDGVAIAAPQIGESVRIFIVSGKVLSPHYPDLEEGEEIAGRSCLYQSHNYKTFKTKEKNA
jgi:peptide deformylase